MSMYYSFNYGNVHVISYTFEEDWGVAPDLWEGGEQYQWLQNDLQSVNRQTQPWIIMFAHRPVYCSTNDGNRCSSQASSVSSSFFFFFLTIFVLFYVNYLIYYFNAKMIIFIYLFIYFYYYCI